jgi:hypothetical protein
MEFQWYPIKQKIKLFLASESISMGKTQECQT